MVEIIQHFSEGKKGPLANEDATVVADDYAVVIDGATSKSSYRYNDTDSNGRFASHVLCNAVRDIPLGMSLQDFSSSLTATIRWEYTHRDILSQVREHTEDRLTASLIVYSVSHREIWMIGDCQALVNGITYSNAKPLDAPSAEKRAIFIHEALISGRKTMSDILIDDIGRRHILSTIIESTHHQNKYPDPYGFSVVDGFDIPMPLVRVITVPQSVSEIVLASDGYPKLYPTLEATEQSLHDIITDDPLLINRYKATKCVLKGQKSFDDRTYLRLKV